MTEAQRNDKVKRLNVYKQKLEHMISQSEGPKQDFFKRDLKKTLKKLEELTK